MFHVWWVFLAFLGGGVAGVLLITLLRVARDEPHQSMRVHDLPKALQ
jgi:hypothetical protein